MTTQQEKFCPSCGKQTLCKIEDCDSNPGEHKSSWGCNCCTNIVYIYEFDEDKLLEAWIGGDLA